ncbi:MAG: hypothetical protein JWM31_2021 [Solirubrobacterales bacterium]|nr:hypothetical protein [Solirubrobacterales bacterium]
MKLLAADRCGAVLAVALGGLAVLLPSVADAHGRMSLSASNGDRGHVRLVVRNAPDTTIEIVERLRGRSLPLTVATASGGVVVLPQAVAWRCDRQVRHFTARARTPNGRVVAAVANIRTPSCRRRVGVVLVGRTLRPRTTAVLRLTDRWTLGGAAVRVCVGLVGHRHQCRTAHLPAGATPLRLPVALTRAGRWEVTVGLPFGGRQRRTFRVAPDGGLKVLISGDSLTYGIPAPLQTLLGEQARAVIGDPHPGTGLTKTNLVDWPAHAFAVGRQIHPDVTVMILGAARDARPLAGRDGGTVTCCDQPWIDAYALQVHHVMSTLLQHGHALVYWTLLPAPRESPEDPTRGLEWDAVNAAVVQAARTFPDAVAALSGVRDGLTPDNVFHPSVMLDGEEHVVRDADGIHLAPYGMQYAARVIEQQLRADGLVR